MNNNNILNMNNNNILNMNQIDVNFVKFSDNPITNNV